MSHVFLRPSFLMKIESTKGAQSSFKENGQKANENVP